MKCHCLVIAALFCFFLPPALAEEPAPAANSEPRAPASGASAPPKAAGVGEVVAPEFVGPNDEQPVQARKAPADDAAPLPIAGQAAPEAKPGEGVASAGEGYYLSLEEAIELAVQSNLNLRLSRLNDRASDIDVREEWARYFPDFNASLNHSNSKISGERAGDGTTSFNGGVTQRSPWGTVLDFDFSESRSRFDTDTASGRARVSVSQPLWKGFGTDVGLAGIRTSRIGRLISRGRLDLETQNLIFNVRRAYAAIIQQIQNREVSRQAVRSARAFLDLTDARYKAGQVTQLEVFNAEVQLRDRELDQVSNERALEDSFDQLKRLLDLDLEEKLRVDAPIVDFGEKTEPNTNKKITSDETAGAVNLVITKDAKEFARILLFQATHFDESVILGEALANRIDLLNSRRDLAVQKLQTMLRKDGLGHQIDLTGSYARSHDGRSFVERDNGDEADSWSVGVNASFPWGKIRDKAGYERALLSLERTEIDLKLARTAVQADVRDIMRRLREFEKSLLIEGQRVEQAKRSVEAAQISFDRGLKDSFNVIQSEDALLRAKRNFISRRLSYVVELARLETVVGKPTGRVDLSGQSAGGLVDSKLQEELVKRGLPKAAPEAEPRPDDDPLNKSREYRKDYKPDRGSPVIVEPGDK